MHKLKIETLIRYTLILCLSIPSLSLAASKDTTRDIPDSLSLDEAIDYAYDHNTDVKNQELNIKIAESIYIQARSNALPQVNLTIQPEHYDNTGASSGSGKTGEEFPAKIEASQPVFSFGKLGSGIRAANYYIDSQKATLEQTRQSIAYSVSAAYYKVLLEEELVNVDTEALKNAEEHLRIAQLRFEQGVNTQFDVTRAKVDVANSKPALISARNELIKAKQNLNQLFNLSPTIDIKLTGTLDYREYSPDLKSVWELAKKNRPDLKSQAFTVKQNEATYSVKKALYFPNIYVGADFTADYAKYQGYDSSRFNSWDAYAKLTMPIFDGLNIWGQIKQARATLEQARINYQDLLLSAQIDVEQAILEINKQKELVDAAKEAIDLAQLSLKMAQLSYQNGKATTLDVTDAELSLTTARSNWATAIHDYLVALAGLKKSLGVNTLPS